MATPAELEFGQLLLVAVAIMLLVAAGLVGFVVIYQKRLLQQQLNLRQVDAAHQQALLAAIIAAQEAERERVGRDLHDDVASSIAMAKMLVDRLAATPAPPDAAALLGLAREVLGTAAEEVRAVSHDLYPAVLTRVGLLEALEYLANLCRRTGTLTVALDTYYPHPLPPAQELALYRICQELTHNVLKHAQGATHLVIRFRQHGPLLVLAVEDDGCGFVMPAPGSAAGAKAGLGLRSIGVRVEMLRARLVQHAAPGQGTHIHIELDHPAAE